MRIAALRLPSAKVAARFLMAGTLGATLLVTGGPAPTKLSAGGSQACDAPTQRVTMYAEELPRDNGQIRLGWGLTPTSASIPGPTMEMMEGECIAITVVNEIPAATLAELRDDARLGSQDPNMPLGVSLHVHGVKYTQQSDGTLQTDSIVAPGASRTYYWYAAPRVVTAGRVTSQGTAGYWWYHDHIAGTDHGTGGLYSGLLGGVVVRRPGDLKPDRPTYVVAMGPNQTINLRHYPDTQRYVANRGERVEFLVIGFGDEFHTFHLHGHNWADNRTGSLTSQADETRLIDTKTIGPAESFGFQVVAGQDVGAGSWMLHCHVQTHSDLGMVTFFDVNDAPGAVTGIPGAPASQSLPGAEHAHYGKNAVQ